LAVIVNVFGSINIDVDLIESRDEKIISLDKGCNFCTLVDGFAAKLTNPLALPHRRTTSTSKPAVLLIHITSGNTTLSWLRVPSIRPKSLNNAPFFNLLANAEA
jgi:hypothetical protein